MKLVKENLFESFTEDSDPIKDMGIGRFRPNRDFNSEKELVEEFYNCIPQIFDPQNKMDWSTEEGFKKNVQYFLHKSEPDNSLSYFPFGSFMINRVKEFKESYKWTVNKKPYNYWYTDINSFLKDKGFDVGSKMEP